jgi:hypothetical protein
MRKFFVVMGILLLLLLALIPASALAGSGDPPDLDTLEPGGFRDIEQNLTINVVFVGY